MKRNLLSRIWKSNKAIKARYLTRSAALLMVLTLACGNISYAAALADASDTAAQHEMYDEEDSGKADIGTTSSAGMSETEDASVSLGEDASEKNQDLSADAPEITEEYSEDTPEEDPKEGSTGSDAAADDVTEAVNDPDQGETEESAAGTETGISDTDTDDEEGLQDGEASEAVSQDEQSDDGEMSEGNGDGDTDTQSDLLIVEEAPGIPEEGAADIGEPLVMEEEPVIETGLAQLQAGSSDVIIYGIDGNQYTPSDFDSDYVALFFGRTGCGNTRFMMELLEKQLDPDDPSVQIVLMDIDSSDEQLKAYAEEFPDRFVSHHDRYVLQYYQLTGTSGSVSLPGLVIIDNATGDVAFSSQGLAQDELYGFLEDAGIMEPTEFCTFKLGGTADYSAAFEALEILNEKRIAAGLRPLVMDESLLAAAMQRAAEIYYYYYSDHSRPDGSRCFTAFPAASGMAENIAAGWIPSAQSAITVWSNSPGHNANMMDPNMTDIGIGCFYCGDSLTDGNIRWVQNFAYGNRRTTAKARDAAYKEFSIKAVSDTVSVGLDANEIELYVGETYIPELSYMSGGSSAGPLIVTFAEADDRSVASVSSNGTIKGNAVGSTVVRIGVDEDHCAEVTVNVVERPVPVQSIALNMEKAEIKVGETLQLKAELSPSNATNKAVTWSVNDSRILSVDESGKVEALKTGTAVVKATAKDGGCQASCEIRVLFTDVPSAGIYYCNPVYWAAGKGITTGYSDGSFGVGRDCQRRELMIFLWRYAGQPTGYGDARKMFNDLSAYGPNSATNKAIAWAYKTGISKGYSDGGFHPEASIVRKDVMIMLYRLAGKPAVSGTLSFSDCKKYNKSSDTYKAILWGSKNGITNGYSDGEYAGQFGDMLNCLREQIVTFLYRYDQKRH